MKRGKGYFNRKSKGYLRNYDILIKFKWITDRIALFMTIHSMAIHSGGDQDLNAKLLKY